MQAVVEAFAQGINFFDTSPFYGDTKSEAVRRRAAPAALLCRAASPLFCAVPAVLRCGKGQGGKRERALRRAG